MMSVHMILPPKRRLDCPVCTHFFKTEREFRFHMRNEHRALYPLVRYERMRNSTFCLVCSESTDNMENHLITTHPQLNLRQGTFKVLLKRYKIRMYNIQPYVFC